MKQLNKKQISTLNSIRNSKGRFFGLYTKQGEAINAQFRGETDEYVNVYDRNNKRTRRIAKSSIATA